MNGVGRPPWPQPSPASAFFRRSSLSFAALSVLLLVPCFWQERIQAGDLSSHVYNAWLAQLIERGQAPGLSLAHQSNNVLFDLMLSTLMPAFGPTAAQRIAVSTAVLVFFWGAFAFIWSCSRPRRTPWQLIPCLVILAYGWVFRMGLFNFYISLGLCFGAMALLRLRKRWAAGAALPIFGIAYVAHALPVAWAAGIVAYTYAAQALTPRRRSWLVIGALACLAIAGLVLGALFLTRRGPDQVMSISGADQIWIHGMRYAALALALLAVWVAYLHCAFRFRGVRRLVLDIRFQLCALSAATLVLLPGGVLLPGFRSVLDYVPERMSLAGGVLFCALMVSVRLPKVLVVAPTLIAVVFFAMSYRDERALNRVETRMERVLAQLPPGQRVVSALEDPDSRVKSMLHLIDRVCVGHCFSYGNYEPCTRQFRVRAERENPIVASNYGDSWHIQNGGYVVKPSDLPLYKVDVCGSDNSEICVAPLDAGDTLRNIGVQVAQLQGKEDQPHE